MDLYVERGFEQTTVAEIAKRAGLTERTFFRHYADKREVLFAGASTLRDLLVTTVADAPDSVTVSKGVESSLIWKPLACTSPASNIFKAFTRDAKAWTTLTAMG